MVVFLVHGNQISGKLACSAHPLYELALQTGFMNDRRRRRIAVQGQNYQ